MRLLKQSEYKVMPWKNKRGETTEIAIAPEQARVEDEDFLWRISSARVNSEGDFSIFKNHQRVLVILDGKSLLLNEKKLSPHQPFYFSGQDSIYCRLPEGEVTDLNVIFDAKKVSMEVTKINSDEVEFAEGSVYFLICADGCVEINALNLKFNLEKMDALRVEESGRLRIKNFGALLFQIRINYFSKSRI